MCQKLSMLCSKFCRHTLIPVGVRVVRLARPRLAGEVKTTTPTESGASGHGPGAKDLGFGAKVESVRQWQDFVN